MGGNESKSIANIVNEVVPEVIIRNTQGCNSSVGLSQTVTNKGLMLGSTVSNTAEVSVSCLANFKVDNSVITQISNEIQQKADAQGVALLDAISKNKSEVNLQLKNIIAPKITTEMVQKVSVTLTQDQRFKNDLFMIGSVVAQDSDVVTKAIMEAVASTGVIQDIQNKSSQSAKTTSKNPLDFLGDIAWYWIMFLLIIVVAIIAGFVAVVWALFK